MSFWSRMAEVFRGDRLGREIDEESLNVRLLAWLDSLRADTVFGWRQLTKRR